MALTREEMVRRAVRELQDGYYVNLDWHADPRCQSHTSGMEVILQSENGLLGIGPFPYEGDEDPDLINAGKQTDHDDLLVVFFQCRFVCNDSRWSYRSGDFRCHVSQEGDRQLDDSRQNGEGHGRRHGPVAGAKRVVVLADSTRRAGSEAT